VAKRKKRRQLTPRRFQGTPVAAVDTVASQYALGMTHPLPPSPQWDDQTFSAVVTRQRVTARAHQLGLTTPSLPPWMTPEIADVIRRIEEQEEWEKVGDTARHAIQEALADTGIAFTAPWAYIVWGRVFHRGQGLLCGRLHWPLHDWPGPTPTREMGTVVARDWIAAYPWDKRFQGYRFEVFGLQSTSEADAEHFASRYPPRARWRMRFPDPSSSTGHSAMEVGAYRVRVFHQDSPIIATSHWHPGWSDVRPSYSGGAIGDDLSIAVHGLELYYGFEPDATGGRRRLEDDPESGWLALTERAIAMKQQQPARHWKSIARALSVHPSTLRTYLRRRDDLART